MPTASVIVCTRNRAAALPRCLESIAADRSTTEAEVIVVDNASTDNTAAVVRHAAAVSPRMLRSIVVDRPGHCRGRNAGIRIAKGSILLFTDDDTEIKLGWIDGLCAPFADPRVGVVGGRIIPVFLDGRPDWLDDDPVYRSITLFDYGPGDFEYSDMYPLLGANMAFRVSILNRDPFDERLGHTGELGYGFDEFLLLKQVSHDHQVVYAPSAVVLHLLDRDRVSLATARRTQLHIGFGNAFYKRLLGEPRPDLARRVVRTARARRTLRACAGGETTAEMRAWREAGMQTGMLLGRRPLTDFVARMATRLASSAAQRGAIDVT